MITVLDDDCRDLFRLLCSAVIVVIGYDYCA